MFVSGFISWTVLLLILVTAVPAGSAEVHHATRLGAPDTRFADPIRSVAEMRRRFSNEVLRRDMKTVLREVGWTGNFEDLFLAASEGLVEELSIPRETRFPFMPTRRDGRLVVLRNVIWKGDHPVEAYKFSFVSNGRLYRCITPKACSNFFVEDIGPEPPGIEISISSPTVAGLCDTFAVRVEAENPMDFPQGGFTVHLSTSEGLEVQGARSIELPGVPASSVEMLSVDLSASEIGMQTVTARLTRGGTTMSAASRSVRIGRPRLKVACNARGTVPLGRAFDLCLVVSNEGEVGVTDFAMNLPVPEGLEVEEPGENMTCSDGEIEWRMPMLASGESVEGCIRLKGSVAGDFDLAIRTDDACAEVEPSGCHFSVVGIPAILLEVVDLEDPIEIGSKVIYEIVALNQGTAPATNVRFECFLPSSQQFVGCNGPTQAAKAGDKVIIEPVPSIPPGGRAVWRLKVDALEVDDARFLVRMLTDQLDRPVEETEATNQY